MKYPNEFHIFIIKMLMVSKREADRESGVED